MGIPKLPPSYIYESLEALAATFDARAAIEERNAKSAAVKQYADRLKGAAGAWRVAAEIIRCTEIKP